MPRKYLPVFLVATLALLALPACASTRTPGDVCGASKYAVVLDTRDGSSFYGTEGSTSAITLYSLAEKDYIASVAQEGVVITQVWTGPDDQNLISWSGVGPKGTLQAKVPRGSSKIVYVCADPSL